MEQQVMPVSSIDVFAAGTWIKVPALSVDGRTVIVTGTSLKMATLKAEEWLDDEVDNPQGIVESLKQQRAHGLRADVFTFGQKLPATVPRHSYHTEWDSSAAIRLDGFATWWEGLPQETRKNTRRSAKRGVIIRQTALDDDVISGIVAINNESPIRQGRRFPHYGATPAEVKRDFSAFLERSDLLCAYSNDELIGLLKIIYCGHVGAIAKLQSKISHFDKRPSNALLAKAIEICAAKGITYVTYGSFRYGNQKTTSLMDFKVRHGFKEILLPRYYVPLTTRGQVAVALGLHHDLRSHLPRGLVSIARGVRSEWYKLRRLNGPV
jgi:hypothetical protein